MRDAISAARPGGPYGTLDLVQHSCLVWTRLVNLPRARVDAISDDVANLRVFAIHDHLAVAVTVEDLVPLAGSHISP
jgi:hypothetical protein